MTRQRFRSAEELTRASVLIEPESIDAAAVLLAGRVFAGNKAHAEQDLHVALDEHLQAPPLTPESLSRLHSRTFAASTAFAVNAARRPPPDL
jgi:hypothetical protein